MALYLYKDNGPRSLAGMYNCELFYLVPNVITTQDLTTGLITFMYGMGN